MPSGSYLSGIVSGFQGRRDELSQRRWTEEQQNNARESKIYEALINSSDPEIQSLAFTGLLDSANPKRKKGLQGWMGEMQKNPALEGIKRLIQTPVTETKPVQTGPPAVTGYLPSAPPSGGGSAALPASSPTTGGAPPPTPLANPAAAAGAVGAAGAAGAAIDASAASPAGIATAPPMAANLGPQQVVDKPFFYNDSTSVQGTPGPQDLGAVQSDPRLATAPPQVGSITSSHPRQVFDSPEQAAVKQARGHAQGQVEGEIQGMVSAGVPEPEARAAYLLKIRKAAGLGGNPNQAFMGQYPDPDRPGKWIDSPAVFNKSTGGWTLPGGKALPAGFRRTPPGGGGSARNKTQLIAEGIARRDYGGTLAELADSDPTSYMAALQDAASLEQENAGKTTAARVSATNEGKLDAPITTATAQKTGAIVGTKERDYAGQQVPTQESMKNEQDLKLVKTRLQALIQPPDGSPSPLNILPSQHELIGGHLPGASMTKRRITNRAEVGRLEAALADIVEPLQRAMGDPRISDKDIVRSATRVASMGQGLFDLAGGDTRESALARIRQTLTDLDLSESNRIKRPTPGGAAGTPPPGAGSRGKSAAPAAGPAGPGQEWQMIDGKLYHNGQPF